MPFATVPDYVGTYVLPPIASDEGRQDKSAGRGGGWPAAPLTRSIAFLYLSPGLLITLRQPPLAYEIRALHW